MKSVGEAMGIGRTFQEAFAKAFASRELDAGAVTPWATLDDLPDDLHPWFRRELDELREHGPPQGAARLPPRRLLRRRGRRRLQLLLLDPRRGRRAAPAERQAARRHPRLRPEPDRAGDRVRLLLRPRRPELPCARLRGDHGQLQPRDGLDRLRHVGPPLLRAARRRVGARGLRARAAGGGRDPVRRPDAAEARPRDRGGRLQGARNAVRGGRPGRGPRALRPAPRRAGRALPGVGDRRRARRRGRDRRPGRLSRPRPALVRARRPRDAGLLRRGPGARRDGRSRRGRRSSTASSKARSRSTSTRSATASPCTSAP